MRHMCLLTLLVTAAVFEVNGAPTQDVDPNLQSFFIEAGDTEQSFSYRTKDGQSRDETISWDPKTGKLVISGWYRYVGPDGLDYMVQYMADENGFRARGAHLPGADPDPRLYTIQVPQSGSLSKTAILSLIG